MKKTVITIARSYGSGGRTLGKLLAKEMGIPCYDRELIRMASDQSGINEALFGAADERKRGFSFLKGVKPYTGKALPPESGDFVSDDNLFSLQAEIIKEVADKGPCIIIGRCAAAGPGGCAAPVFLRAQGGLLKAPSGGVRRAGAGAEPQD